MENEDNMLAEVLVKLGLEPKPSAIEQLRVFKEAMHIFEERNAEYGDLWREYGCEDNLLHMRSKLARTERSAKLKGFNADLDSPLDLLNYTVFFIRNARASNDVA